MRLRHPGSGATVKLTAQKSAAIRDQMELIAALEGELGWLSDSANLVIKAGAEVERIVMTVDGQNATCYGVGLHREFPGTPTSFASVATNEPCFLPQSLFVDCRRSILEAEFSIAEVGPPTQPLMSSRSASLAHVSVPGVTIRIQFASP